MTESKDFTQQVFRVMGGPASLTIRHKRTDRQAAEVACNTVRNELDAMEARYSRYKPDSLVSQINRTAGSGIPVEIDDEMRGLLTFCQQLHKQSDGLFDPTAGALNTVWNLQEGRIDSPERLPEILDAVGWQHVHVSAAGVYLGNANTRLDLGGIVKEFAVDSAVKRLQAAGFQNHIVELAGDVFASGTNTNGQPWRIGISDPSSPDKAIQTVELTDAALASSGSSQRFFTYKGKQYNHFINPKTGKPVEGAISASVVAENTLIAGAIATVACLHGANNAEAWLERSALPWLLIDESGLLHGPLADSARYPI